MELLLQGVTCWLFIQLLFTVWNLRQMPRLGEPVKRQKWEQHYADLPAIVKQSAASSLPLANCENHEFNTEYRVYENRSRSMLPLLSVLIPARDEEINIRECLESILACRTNTIELEILVMNDHSEDRTAEEVRQLMAHDARIRLYEGEPLPEQWMGKSYACHQLSLHARGEWWLFVDADVRLHPEALEASMITARSQGTGIISGFPRMETRTWLEKLVVPMMAFVIGYHLPIRMIRRSPRPSFLAVMGAYMMIHRDSYHRCGGHAHIFDHIVEDMEIAKAVKKAGDPVTLADVHAYTSARMYRNAAQVWEGYKKNIFAGTGRNPMLACGVILLYTFLFLFPLTGIIMGMVTGQTVLIGWGITAVFIGMLTKGIIDSFSGKPFWMGVFMPVSAACLILILLDSWFTSLNGKGYSWKGRTYG